MSDLPHIKDFGFCRSYKNMTLDELYAEAQFLKRYLERENIGAGAKRTFTDALAYARELIKSKVSTLPN